MLVACRRAVARAHRAAHRSLDRRETDGQGQQDDSERTENQAHGSQYRTRGLAGHSATRRRRSALLTTDTELSVMAALATMGLSTSPNQG